MRDSLINDSAILALLLPQEAPADTHVVAPRYKFVYTAAPDPTSYEPPHGFVYNGVVSNVIIDSIAADTTDGIPHFVPVEVSDSLRMQAEASANAPVAVVHASGRHEGLPPEIFPSVYGHNTPLIAIMVGVLVIAALCGASMVRAIKGYKSELWSIRCRPNVFDDEKTDRGPLALLLAIIFIIFGGIVLYNCPTAPQTTSLTGVAASMALVAGYYVFQRCAYGLVGYAFADPDQNKRWIGGYHATQAFAGLGMAVPAILMVCRPEWHDILLIIAISIYELFHLVFIIKGIRIFYHKIASLLYFILYLCTLEIIPQLALYRLSIVLTGFTG